MPELNCDSTGVIECQQLAEHPCEVDVVDNRASCAQPTSVKPAAVNRGELTQLGEYRIVRKLGEGGMGAVYLAVTPQGDRVAIKVMARDSVPDATAALRFQKEARMLAAIQHPNVTNLLEVGQIDQTCFLVMEFVDGLDLKNVLEREPQLDERVALEITRDIASALATAHQQNIIHRDLKPANILLSAQPRGNESPEEALFRCLAAGQKPTVQLTDFGLARHVNQTASLELTRTGVMLGTPYYISPEQCTDIGQIGPTADIYSLGATLFEMLAGRPPFMGSDPVKVISMHCFEQAPDLRKLNPSVSDATAQLVSRTLEKLPVRRHADATQLIADIERFLTGEIGEVESHPREPATHGHVTHAQWTWELESDPEQLWPLASNTERINCAVGVPSAEYRTERDAQGTLHRFGSFRLGWATLAWEEHPFEWIEGQRFGVLREFQSGPFHWFLSIVELTPRPTGGTRLTHTVRIATRGILGRLLAHVEVKLKGRKGLDRVYRRMDAVASGRLRGGVAPDAFEPAKRLPRDAAARFETRHDRLLATGAEPTSAGRLVEYLQTAALQELSRIRPQALARQLNLAPEVLAETCLHACQAGLLELHWDILCPTCRIASSVADTLTEIERHAHCEACDLDFDVDFRSAVELIFRIHPELRQADLKTYCIGGPEHAPHVVAQTRIAPAETLELDLALEPGTYLLRGPQLPYTVALTIRAGDAGHRGVLALTPGQRATTSLECGAGRQLLTIRNGHSHPQIIRIERTIPRKDVLTAAAATRMPLFKQLFPEQAISRKQLSNYAETTYLAVRVTNAAELIASQGETVTSDIIADRFAEIRGDVTAAGGQIVNEDSHQMLATFAQRLHAVCLATDLLMHSRESATTTQTAQIRTALSRGMSLSTTQGTASSEQNPAICAATLLLESADDRTLLLSTELETDTEIQALLAERGLAFGPSGASPVLAAR